MTNHPFYAIMILCQAQRYLDAQMKHLAKFKFDHIVLVEGPSRLGPGQADGDGRRLLPNGKIHSTDGTLETARIWAMRDPSKISVIVHDQVWYGKTQMFNAANALLQHKKFGPGYIWHIDADEAYFIDDMEAIREVLNISPYTDVEFWCRNFWGDIHHHQELSPDCPWANKGSPWRRVFWWEPGMIWASHEPSRMKRNGREKLLTRDQTAELGVYLHHYGYCFRDELVRREKFYNLGAGSLTGPWDKWQKTKSMDTPGGRLSHYTGEHPITFP